MKIVFTAGGSGGHFYPIIAVAEEIQAIVSERNLVQPELYYLSDTPYDSMLLYQNEIEYRHVPAGKLRLYASLENVTDFLRTLIGLPVALRTLFKIYPDVVFSKGSYASVPVVSAARLLRIPVIIHDSDAVPGRANLWAGGFAVRIGTSYPEAAEHFERKDRIACVGNPIRQEVRTALTHDAHAFFQLTPTLPTVFVVGGSQGSELMNSALLQALPELLNEVQVIHQVGPGQFTSFKEIAQVELANHPHVERYRMFPTLNALEYRSAAGAANLIVSRAGSGSIFEIASWEKPAILVPIPESVSRDQRQNAYAYARTGACEVIEQHNCTPHVLTSEIRRILGDQALCERMRAGAASFKRPDAARTIAQEVVRMALEHVL